MKHSKRLITVLVVFWLVILPVATVVDSMLFKSEATRNFVAYGISDNVFYAFLLQNVHETFIFSLGMLFAYVLYRKDIYRWFG